MCLFDLLTLLTKCLIRLSLIFLVKFNLRQPMLNLNRLPSFTPSGTEKKAYFVLSLNKKNIVSV